MAITDTADDMLIPHDLYTAVKDAYTWAATAPQTTTYDTDAKRRQYAIDTVFSRNKHRWALHKVQLAAAGFTGEA